MDCNRRHFRYFSIDVHFPKLDVAGSNPVSRSISFQWLTDDLPSTNAFLPPNSTCYLSEREGGVRKPLI
jgi:hypothetical protein